MCFALLTPDVPELSSCCFILLSYRRNWRRESPAGRRSIPSWAFWPVLPSVLPAGFRPASFLGGGVTSCALGVHSLHSPVAGLQGIPLLAKQILSPSCPSCLSIPLLCWLVFGELRSPLVSERHKRLPQPRWPVGTTALLGQLFPWLELLLLKPNLLHMGQLLAAAAPKPESVPWCRGPVQGHWSQQDIPQTLHGHE